MTNWITKKADEIKQAEAAEQKQRDWELHKAEIIRQNWQEAWRGIELVIDEDVAAFNAQFPTETQKHIQISGSGIIRHGQVTRVLQPSASVQGVSLRLIVTGPDGRQIVNPDSLAWTATSAGIVGLAKNGGVMTSAEASERILRHLF